MDKDTAAYALVHVERAMRELQAYAYDLPTQHVSAVTEQLEKALALIGPWGAGPKANVMTNPTVPTRTPSGRG